MIITTNISETTHYPPWWRNAIILLYKTNVMHSSNIWLIFNTELSTILQTKQIYSSQLAKKEDNNIKFRDYIHTRWNGYHTIFTDGSVSDDKSVGIRAYIPVINLKFSARIPYMSICTAKTLAIIKALKVIMENEWEESNYLRGLKKCSRTYEQY